MTYMFESKQIINNINFYTKCDQRYNINKMSRASAVPVWVKPNYELEKTSVCLIKG